MAPDGRRIAFTSDRSGGEDLYVMGFDGSGQTRVTDRGAPDREPSFSADGQRLAYSVVHASTLPGGPSEGDIWTVNVDGTETTRLTFERDLDQFDPAVSPDGSRIAFVAATPGGPSSSRDVMVMDADGSNVTNLTVANGGDGFEDADPAFSPDGSSIAFSSDRDGGTEVWVMDADGSDPVQLTDQPGADQQPAFSPDGTKIAFTARRGGRTDVYTMNAADGSGQTRVTGQTTLDEKDELASWQPVPPAGQLEAFIDSGPAIVGSDRDVTFTYTGLPSSQVSGLQCRLDDDGFSQCPAAGISYSELADGKHVFRVRAVGSGGPDPEAAAYRFEIDTTRIVFAAGEGNDSEIYAVNPDGSGRVRLTNNAARDTEPALSPDGSRVAFISNRDGDDEVFVMNADGSGAVTKLTNNSASERSPAYSPDGSEIAFVTRRDGDLEVYAMNADGTAPTNLTNDPAADSEPSFSGDGTKIAFESDRAAGNVDIYSMNADGTATTRLTTYPNTDKSPDFSPDGKQIAFTRNVLDPGGPLPSNDEIFVMSASGSRGDEHHQPPSWDRRSRALLPARRGEDRLPGPGRHLRPEPRRHRADQGYEQCGSGVRARLGPGVRRCLPAGDPNRLRPWIADQRPHSHLHLLLDRRWLELRVPGGLGRLRAVHVAPVWTRAPSRPAARPTPPRRSPTASTAFGCGPLIGPATPIRRRRSICSRSTGPHRTSRRSRPPFLARPRTTTHRWSKAMQTGRSSSTPRPTARGPQSRAAPLPSSRAPGSRWPSRTTPPRPSTLPPPMPAASPPAARSTRSPMSRIRPSAHRRRRSESSARAARRSPSRPRCRPREDSDAKARGKVEVGKKSYKLKRETKSVISGKSKNLKLRLKRPKDARRIAKALDQGKKAVARITVKLIDEVGNVEAESFRVKLKR